MTDVHCFNDTATTEMYPLSLHDALPISALRDLLQQRCRTIGIALSHQPVDRGQELLERLVEGVAHQVHAPHLQPALDRKSTRLNSQSRQYLVCRLLLENTTDAFRC